MVSRIARIVVALTALVLPVLTLAAAPARADAQSDFLGWVNGLRSGVLAPALTADVNFNSVAQQWAAHLAATGVLAHNPTLSSQAPQGWTKMGENIGSGYSLTAVYNALVASPDHYANMVDTAYNRTGVGVATDSKGQYWVTEDFGSYPAPTPATMVFPTSGILIFPQAQGFSWNQASGGQYYCLTVGTTQGVVVGAGHQCVVHGRQAVSHADVLAHLGPPLRRLGRQVGVVGQ